MHNIIDVKRLTMSIRTAISKCDDDGLSQLIQLSTNIAIEDIIWAVEKGNINAVKLLNQAGVSVNPNLKTTLPHLSHREPLVLATLSGNVKMVKTLLALGSNVNYRDTDGWNAYFYASDGNHREIVKLLLRHGAHIGPDNLGRMPPDMTF